MRKTPRILLPCRHAENPTLGGHRGPCRSEVPAIFCLLPKSSSQTALQNPPLHVAGHCLRRAAPASLQGLPTAWLSNMQASPLPGPYTRPAHQAPEQSPGGSERSIRLLSSYMKKVSVGHSPESSLLVLNMHVPAQEAILQVCVCVLGVRWCRVGEE